ncbi:MAG: tRNA 4-thiouridine(8) synthase ThiI [Candidatus Omnitrophota bacterium]|nr:tRNA 4-thiouridine(8) synthase ThiI [Candidatus Omnitrophota bacterium]MBU1929688.1 tRNA 4-thiouridine(8) synthase ThiI [Candidatus Omnitrophota bacterium]MBU2035086.1 tRNA 4-thiouridine(8) synthase ThiI [Candidatus Omnitrophota bacterium]MBU2258564.1 tRNA 4-thiouridine(8) synthase ThiI [Candidatus Omnitrophota bacterium]
MKAIALISGGLDSILAARVVSGLGIDVTAVFFKIPFFCNPKKPGIKPEDAIRKLTGSLGIKLAVIVLADDFLEIVRHPAHGYGSNVNPCIDCKIFMLKKAAEFMRSSGSQFLVTGEVLGQRPMSQNKQSLGVIEKESGLEGLILRPLSARLLNETIPEKKGWVKREALLDFNGRSRAPQIELALKFGIKDYSSPAGGCLLTDPHFADRVKDLLNHNELTVENVGLIKVGRYFRVSADVKLAVGRNEAEDNRIISLALPGDFLFDPPADVAGTTALGRGKFNDQTIQLCASIASRYCDLNGQQSINIIYRIFPLEEEKIITVSPLSEEELVKIRI